LTGDLFDIFRKGRKFSGETCEVCSSTVNVVNWEFTGTAEDVEGRASLFDEFGVVLERH
jgi:hypothetical protein